MKIDDNKKLELYRQFVENLKKLVRKPEGYDFGMRGKIEDMIWHLEFDLTE